MQTSSATSKVLFDFSIDWKLAAISDDDFMTFGHSYAAHGIRAIEEARGTLEEMVQHQRILRPKQIN